MSADDLYHQLGLLISSAPSLATSQQTPDEQMWLAQVRAAIRETNDLLNDAALREAFSMLSLPNTGTFRLKAKAAIMQCLYNALAVANLKASGPMRGAFLPAGNAFDALMAVRKVLETATSSVMFVDPYADSQILETYAAQAQTDVSVRILADAAHVKPSLKPAMSAWTAQHQSSRPVEARLTTPRTLHDRLMIVDDGTVWTVGQSFNGLATRSPTTITRIDVDTGNLKIAAYQALWGSASPL